MTFAYFAWPLGRRLAQPLQRTLGILARRRCAALGTVATASAMLLVPRPSLARVVRADDTELTAEERRTVELFKHCSGSVVHINTFVPGN